MKYEAEVWVKLHANRKDGEIKSVSVSNMWQKPRPGTIRLSISVPETYFTNSPTIKVELPEAEAQEFEGVVLD